jgi:hypothetical protein
LHAHRTFGLAFVVVVAATAIDAGATPPCRDGWEESGKLCYPQCRQGYSGVGPVCWESCRPGFHDDGATCRKDANIIGSDNSSCPLGDKCGLTYAKGCSRCPANYHNDGCTCRQDVQIYGKSSYTRGAGELPPTLGKPQPPNVTIGNYDLVWDSTDDNGFPFMARWGKQELYRRKFPGAVNFKDAAAMPDIRADCLDYAEKHSFWNLYDGYNPMANNRVCRIQPTTIDNCWFGKCLWPAYTIDYHVTGHTNFQTAHYEGPITWECSAEISKGGDFDWGMDMYPAGGVGVTDKDWFRLHMEWDPQETGEAFDFGWWAKVKGGVHEGWSWRSTASYDEPTCAAQRGDKGTVGRYLNRRKAMAIGLMGLDLGHDSAMSELHPIFGIAIHTNGELAADVRNLGAHWDTVPLEPSDDTWAIMARNWGNEGYCSSMDAHALDARHLTFRIPWPPLATAVEVLPSTQFRGWTAAGNDQDKAALGINVWVDHEKRAVFVTALLPRPEAHGNVFGEAHLRWTMAAPPKRTVFVPAALTPPPRVEHEGAQELVDKMTPDQKKRYEAAVANIHAPVPPKVSVAPLRVVKAAPPVPHVAPATRAIADAAEREHQRQKLAALCAAYGGKHPYPWLAQACEALAKQPSPPAQR